MWGDGQASATAGADGVATATIRPTGRQSWTVSQVTVSMTDAPSTALCELRKNSAIVVPYLLAQGDTAGNDPPVVLRHNDYLRIIWSRCTPGNVGQVYYIYDDGT